MTSAIINRKNVRIRREKSITGTGQVWVCARDFLSAAGLATPRSLSGDYLAQHLGAEAVQTVKIHNNGTIHRLIYVHSESLLGLVRLFHTGEPHRTATLALKGIATAYGVPFMPTESVPAEVEPEGKPEVSTYDFNGMTLRVVQIDGEPWFVAPDACRALGMDMTAGTSQWLVKVGKDEKRRVTKKTHPDLFSGSSWHTNILSESGLYKLITRSDKPEAKPFQEWVTRDVLPSIRKTESYSLTDGTEPANPVSGEIVQSSRAGDIESEFKAMVSTRFNRRTQQIAALKAELHELETAQDKDSSLLSLLAA